MHTGDFEGPGYVGNNSRHASRVLNLKGVKNFVSAQIRLTS
jgi:hypothetical protein